MSLLAFPAPGATALARRVLRAAFGVQREQLFAQRVPGLAGVPARQIVDGGNPCPDSRSQFRPAQPSA